MDKLNADGNTIGRLGALLVIAVAVIGLGRVCGKGAAMCPTTSSGKCCFFSTSTQLKPADKPK